MSRNSGAKRFFRHLQDSQAKTAENKVYALRARPLRWVASSALGAEDRGQSTSGTLVLCFAARRFGHILASRIFIRD
jgi:hypothetical protein